MPYISKVNHSTLLVQFYILYSKCNSQWENCIGPDEKYLRGTDYYGQLHGNTCPFYNPNVKSDPYPGQPFFDDEEQPKANSYLPPKSNIYNENKYICNPLHTYSQSYNRRQETILIKESAKGQVCRLWTNMGNKVVCDGNIEYREGTYTEIVATHAPIANNNDLSGRGDDDDFDEL